MTGFTHPLVSPPMAPYAVLLSGGAGSTFNKSIISAVSTAGLAATARIDLYEDGRIIGTASGTFPSVSGTDHWLNVTRPVPYPAYWAKLTVNSGNVGDLTGAAVGAWVKIQQGVSYWQVSGVAGDKNITYSLDFCVDTGGGAPTTVVLATFPLMILQSQHRSLTPPVWTTQSAPGGTTGVAYDYSFVATGATLYVLGTGALPDGLILTPAGRLYGFPTVASDFAFTVVASNTDGAVSSATQHVQIQLPLALPTFTAQSPPNGVVAVPYSYQYQAVAAVTGYALASGSLPPGLALSATGLLSGTPTTAGLLSPGTFAYGFRVSATNATGTSLSDPQSIVIAFPNPVWTNYAPPPGDTFGAYSYTFIAAPGPCTYVLATGALPGGLTLHAATGILDGTPSAIGTFNFTLTATNAGGATVSPAISIPVTAVPPVPVFTQQSAPAGTAGVAYTYTFAAGPSVTAYAVSAGSLPPGLSLASATGVLSGTPSAPGSYNFTIQATNITGSGYSNNQPVSIAISAPLWSAQAPPAGINGQPYSYQYAAGPSVTAYTLATGTLPPGLSLSNAGLLSGTPTVTSTFNFVLSATNSTGTTNSSAQALVIGITVPSFSEQAAPAGVVGQAYVYNFVAAPNVSSYALASGTLPAGLALSGAGSLSGTPTTAATSTFTVRATNVSGAADSVAQNVTMSVPPRFVVQHGSVWSNSLDGITWSACSGAMHATASDVFIAGKGIFLSVPYSTNNLYRSAGGVIWALQGNNMFPSNAFNWNAGCFDGAYFYVGNASGPMYRSPDGITWTSLGSPTGTGIGTLFATPAGLFVVSTSSSPTSVYRSTDFGATFTSITMPQMAAGIGPPIASWSVASNVVALFSRQNWSGQGTAQGYNYSADGGITWTLAQLPAAPSALRYAATNSLGSVSVEAGAESNSTGFRGPVNAQVVGGLPLIDGGWQPSGMAYGAGCWITAGSYVVRSTDGTTWTTPTITGSGSIGQAAFG